MFGNAEHLDASERSVIMKDNNVIEYRYIDMDTKKIVKDQETLSGQLPKGSLLRAIPSYNYNQVLIAGGQHYFSESDAIILSRKAECRTS